MCVSTGIAGIPKEKHSIMAAVLGPTPFRLISQDFATSKGISERKLKSKDPSSSLTSLSMDLILGAFVFDKPPRLIANSIFSIGASAMLSKSPKIFIRFKKALSEFMSEVCCDKMVYTSSSAALYLGSHGMGP